MTLNATALRNSVVLGNQLPNRETERACQMPNQRPVAQKNVLPQMTGLSVWVPPVGSVSGKRR